MAGTAGRPRLRAWHEPRYPEAPRRQGGGTDGPHDRRARARRRPLAVAGSRRVRARFRASARHARSLVTDSDPARLLERLRAANRGGDVHLIGGPRTIETFRALGV